MDLQQLIKKQIPKNLQKLEFNWLKRMSPGLKAKFEKALEVLKNGR